MELILLIAIALLLFFSFLIWRLKKANHIQEQTLQAQKEKIALLSLELAQKQEKIQDLKTEFENQKQILQNHYDQNLKQLEEKYTQNLLSFKEEFTAQSKLHTQNLLAQNKNLIHEDSKKILEEIFTPLKEQVKHYSTRLVQNETSIQTSLKHMFEYSQNVGKNADKLAQILKGDKKVRGNFGEIQLKSILENSGLIEGEQYKLQESLRIEGSRYIPDAIIYLEKHKSIIIDSKFSLPNDFDLFEHNPLIRTQIASNLKDRIDELAKKPYKDFDSHTYDFILLFIPYQNILDLALDENPTLYQYAYNKKIYLTTPHTLFMALKTIHISWIDIKRNENAQKAFEEIGKFYDKFVGVLESFEKIEQHLEKLNEAKGILENRLKSGQGNLSNHFEKLRELGAKNKKTIPLQP